MAAPAAPTAAWHGVVAEIERIIRVKGMVSNGVLGLEVDRDDIPHVHKEGVPVKPEWPAATLEATERYTVEAFGFFRVPHRYIDTGVRADRAVPFLLRATALVRSYKRDLDRNRSVLHEIRRELASREYRLTEVRILDLLIWSVSAAP